MYYKTFTAALLLSIALAGIATASEIYKWTDSDGNVHYTDKPIDESSVRVAIASRPTNNANVQSQTRARIERRQARTDAAASNPEGPTAEELRTESRQRKEKCGEYKARLTTFVQSRRLYREGADGERVYLDAAEIQSARQKAEQQVEEYCGS